jgi:hypothetical protein
MNIKKLYILIFLTCIVISKVGLIDGYKFIQKDAAKITKVFTEIETKASAAVNAQISAKAMLPNSANAGTNIDGTRTSFNSNKYSDRNGISQLGSQFRTFLSNQYPIKLAYNIVSNFSSINTLIINRLIFDGIKCHEENHNFPLLLLSKSKIYKYFALTLHGI